MAGQRVEVVVEHREYPRVRPERYPGAVLVGPAGAFQFSPGFAPPVFLEVGPAVPSDLGAEVFRQGVHDRCAHAVEPAGDLVGPAAELPPCVQGGHDGLEGGDAGEGVLVDGDAPAVVRHGDRAVSGDADGDGVAVAGHGLVHGVVDYLVDEVVDAALAGRADVHAGSLPDGLQPLEDLDVAGGVVVLRGLLGAGPGAAGVLAPRRLGLLLSGFFRSGVFRPGLRRRRGLRLPWFREPGLLGPAGGRGVLDVRRGLLRPGPGVRLRLGLRIFLGDLEGCLHGLCGPPGLSVELDYMMPFRGLPLSGVISVLLRWPCTLSGGPFPCGPFRGWRSPQFRWT